MRLSNLRDVLQTWAQSERNWRLGKLRVDTLGYEFGESGWTTPGGAFLKAFEDRNGRMVQMVNHRAVNNCPAPPLDAPFVRLGYSVRESVCKNAQTGCRAGSAKR